MCLVSMLAGLRAGWLVGGLRGLEVLAGEADEVIALLP